MLHSLLVHFLIFWDESSKLSAVSDQRIAEDRNKPDMLDLLKVHFLG